MNNSYLYRSARHQWLAQHGDRNESDVLLDRHGDFVFMQNSYYEVKVYLPLNCQFENVLIHRTELKHDDYMKV